MSRVDITAFTKGKPFIMRANTRTYTDYLERQREISVLDIEVNGFEVTVHFESAQELIAFCQKRNISCADIRSRNGVERYLLAKRSAA